MSDRQYDNSLVYVFLMFVGAVILAIAVAKLDYDYRKRIVKEAIEEMKREAHPTHGEHQP